MVAHTRLPSNTGPRMPSQLCQSIQKWALNGGTGRSSNRQPIT
jgi:hypothetical protein